CSSALGDAEGEIQRTLMWLHTEQRMYWAAQVRKRRALLGRAKEALRRQEVFKGPAGARQSVVDEQKAGALATRRLAEAEQKVLAVKKYTTALEKEYSLYKGSVQRFATSVESEVPRAAHEMEQIIRHLEQYTAGGAEAPGEVTSRADDATSMRRAEEDAAATAPAGEGPATEAPSAEPASGAECGAGQMETLHEPSSNAPVEESGDASDDDSSRHPAGGRSGTEAADTREGSA